MSDKEIGQKLDTLIILMAKQLYGHRKMAEVLIPLAAMGLSANQIALVFETSPKNVSNRLGEIRKSGVSTSEATDGN